MNVNSLFLHFTFRASKFTKEIYNGFLNQWIEIQSTLKNRGIDEVFSLIPAADDKIRKWQTMFGLEPFMQFGNYVVYRGVL